MTAYFIQAFIYLTAAVIAVPIAKKLGLGSVLGYLIAGVAIGPVAGLVGDETSAIQHFAEFGVVMMLFLVGLELAPRALWQMRNRLLGLGGLQLAGCAMLIMLLPSALGVTATQSLAIGLIFSLSSTAIVLQTFNEKGLSRTDGAKSAFSILLFQDIAVIPMLAFIPLLAAPELLAGLAGSEVENHDSLSIVQGLPGWAYALVVISAISGLVVAGHFLSRPIFRYIAQSGLREMFVAFALLLIVAITVLMSLIGLSPALGTFLAGVVLANSEFRHELETNIEPFKGLLLGLFFITVGAGIDFGVFVNEFALIAGLTLGVIAIKALVIYLLATLFSIRGSDRWLVALSLAQAGEFGFVLLSFSVQHGVLDTGWTQILQMVVATSMFLTPALFIVFDRVILPRYQVAATQGEPDTISEKGQVIIAGAGRFGQVINRLLLANGVKTVVLDHQAALVENMRSIAIKTYFGDATRMDLLHTAGLEHASLLVIAIDNKEEAIELVRKVKHSYPHLSVFCRAYDRRDLYLLRQAGADFILPETYHSALEMGAEALKYMGFNAESVESKKARFKALQSDASDALYAQWLKGSEGEQFGTDYRRLFMEYEEKIRAEMQQGPTEPPQSGS